ncbi:glycoside hydrolase family 13 protein [Paenibacillus sp. GM2]|uniref:glycoside hydrolase family 13 protein n=1 Tax=Paenibacillus sp. GM2 TaxID=1622070 RepID=UPI0008384724|nr:alpha-glucosidase [Paenibacillus sp. GM2]
MKKTWWKESVVYQIYPRSFQDSNGDGIGDIPGIISRLDYLQKLGVDVIWLCPVYESPNDDNGYDISNYRGIMDEFGTIEDWERLLDGLHSRGMKLIMDLVVNHTSDEHAWFVESRKSKDNPYRDYYIWRDGKDSKEAKEPNNWSSIFSGSAWKYDEATEQYYLHLFSKKQPDLNWENEKVRREVYDLMTWWLDKGIDGFRMDVINMISKVEGLPDGEGEGKYKDGSKYFMNGPRIHEFLQEMNREVLSKYDVMTVGETPGVSPEEAALYVGEDRGELSMVFQFESMDIDSGPGGKWFVTPWKLLDFKRIMSKWQTELEGKGWNSLFLNNHDQPRMVSRFGDDGKYRKQSAKMLGTLLHTMQGTPFIYQGEELGMTNVKFATIEEYQDIETHNMFNEHREAGRAVEEIMASIYSKGRDNARTPMQWDATAHGGFTTGTPWLVVNPNYQEINAGEAMADPDSIFHYYRRLIELRKQHEVIVYGKYQLLLEDHEHIYAYTRTWGDERLLVILNFFADPVTFELPASVGYQSYERLIGNYEWSEGTRLEQMELRPYEAQVLRLS